MYITNQYKELLDSFDKVIISCKLMFEKQDMILKNKSQNSAASMYSSNIITSSVFENFTLHQQLPHHPLCVQRTEEGGWRGSKILNFYKMYYAFNPP